MAPHATANRGVPPSRRAAPPALRIAEESPTRRIAREHTPSVLLVENYEGGPEPVSLGTGWFTRSTKTNKLLVVTAGHVVAGGSKARFTDHTNTEYQCLLALMDPETDTAVFEVTGDNTSAIQGLVLATEEPLPGDEVCTIGHPRGQMFSMSKGVVSALRTQPLQGQQTAVRLIQTDCTVNPGNSGGAFLNMAGEVVGIADFILTGLGGGSDGLNYGVGTASFKSAIEGIKNDQLAAEVIKGVTFVDTPYGQVIAVRSYGGARKNFTPPIVRRKPTLMQRIGAGLLPRDERQLIKEERSTSLIMRDLDRTTVVTHVNGKPVNSVNDAIRAARSSSAAAATVTTIRGYGFNEVNAPPQTILRPVNWECIKNR